MVADNILSNIELLDKMRTTWQRRQRWHKAEKSLTLQCKAVCRGDPSVPQGNEETDIAENKAAANALFERIEAFYDGIGPSTGTNAEVTVMPFLRARQNLTVEREAIEKTFERMAKNLPIAPFIEETYGLGYLLCGAICAESVSEDADSPGHYDTIAGLWSRFGVGIRDGQRQRKIKGKKKEEGEVTAAEEQGYAPERRSLLWNVGNHLIGYMGLGPRLPVDPQAAKEMYKRLHPYQKVFVDQLRSQAAKHPEFRLKDVKKKDKATGEIIIRESYSRHCAARAKRFVEKRFLRDLYHEWQDYTGMEEREDYQPYAEAARLTLSEENMQ